MYIPLLQNWVNYYKCFSGHCRTPLKRTELHDAAERGKVKRVQRLLSTGSLNINSRTVIVSISIMALVDTIVSDFQLLVVASEEL